MKIKNKKMISVLKFCKLEMNQANECIDDTDDEIEAINLNLFKITLKKSSNKN